MSTPRSIRQARREAQRREFDPRWRESEQRAAAEAATQIDGDRAGKKGQVPR